MESGADGLGRHAMDLRKFSDSETPVIGDLGSDIGDESRITDSAFAVEDPLVGSWFPLLHFTDDLIQLRFFSRPYPCRPFSLFLQFL
jgi:hypothetical protein